MFNSKLVVMQPESIYVLHSTMHMGGVEVSTDPKDNAITISTAKIMVESEDFDNIQLRVDLAGKDTQRVFDQIPKSFLFDVFGKDAVTELLTGNPFWIRHSPGKTEGEGLEGQHSPDRRRTQIVVRSWKRIWFQCHAGARKFFKLKPAVHDHLKREGYILRALDRSVALVNSSISLANCICSSNDSIQ
ncbi:hypothetical protein C3L33_22676, partial [Rhododendron williamsianum]